MARLTKTEKMLGDLTHTHRMRCYFYSNSGDANATHCWVIYTVPVLFRLSRVAGLTDLVSECEYTATVVNAPNVQYFITFRRRTVLFMYLLRT
jgi:hypothetical protein